MAASLDQYDLMKSFFNFTADDEARLRALGPVFAKHGKSITDAFYEHLAQYSETAALIEGRVDALKATHARWMGELFGGTYDEAYFNNRLRIGAAHVRIGLSPEYVEGVMSFLRTEGLRAIQTEVSEATQQLEMYTSLCKILDLDLALINVAYAEERIDRLTNFTGLSRKLIERCILKG